MKDVLRRKWQGLLQAWAAAAPLAERTWEDVRRHYAEPGRFYHTLAHIQNMLETVEGLGSFCRDLNAVLLATWLHDVIYESRATDNEERSARYAERLAEELSIPEGPRVASLILKTKTHDAGEDRDAAVLLDADLAILGACEPVYQDYAEKIRREYGWVAETEYRQGRRRVVVGFLHRPKIYRFLDHLEEPARRNLTQEIARLSEVGAEG
jgi:predicted metal-dependent HD superfamily phosphohydrolase